MFPESYAPPTALFVQAPANRVALYSPAQAAWGAILGGPIGLLYFLRRNFLALGNASAARNSLRLGVPIALAIVVIACVLPQLPDAPFIALYWFGARSVVESKQLTKKAISESSEYVFQSNWNVLGMSILCGLASYVLIVGVAFALIILDVI